MRQALIALEIATTRKLYEYVWPRLALDRALAVLALAHRAPVR